MTKQAMKENLTLLQSLTPEKKTAFFEYMNCTGALDIMADLIEAEFLDFIAENKRDIYNA
jgi:hypothetical protein